MSKLNVGVAACRQYFYSVPHHLPYGIISHGSRFEWTSNHHSYILDNNEIGPYTVCRTVNKYHVFKYEMHINRLINTINYDFHTNGYRDKLKNIKISSSVVRETLNNVLYEGLNKFYKNGHVNDHETRIMIYVDVNQLFKYLSTGYLLNTDIFKKCLITHFCHLPDTKRPVRAIVRALADGATSPFNPQKKDTKWFKDRKVWENPETDEKLQLNEVLMYNKDNDYIFEGLSSSFGVLKNDNTNGCTLCIPSLEMGVLNGTVRSFVVDVLKEYNGINIAYEAPKVEDSDDWIAAMVMSTSRLVLPIDELYFDIKGHKMDKECIRFDNDNNFCLQDFEMFINDKILHHSNLISELFNR